MDLEKGGVVEELAEKYDLPPETVRSIAEDILDLLSSLTGEAGEGA